MTKEEIDTITDLLFGNGYDMLKTINDLSNKLKEKDKEIKRLNNIIEEFEKWITFSDTESFNPALNYDDVCKMEYIYVDDLIDKLKELKGSDK